ncbi:MAG: response regulator [Nitrospirae bacterium]|nr:response regulator [Nitrospirota bacterium]
MLDEDIKILCVDDEQNVLNSLKRLFLDDNYTILTATSGQEGLKTLEQEHVQLVISDYRMPVMNGVEFLREVYKQWPNTVRIVLSGYADTAAIVSAINEGHIYKFIPKPWNDDELKVTVSNALERYFLLKKNAKLVSEIEALYKKMKSIIEEKPEDLSILDTLPVGVMVIDHNNMIASCNSLVADITGNNSLPLNQGIEQVLPESIIHFIEKIRNNVRTSIQLEISGSTIKLLGKATDHNSVTLILIRKDDLS